MAYERQYHTNGDVLEASHLNHMEAGIKENSDSVSKLSEEKVSNPSTGEVGQILEIETVDENGKPKTYKAVDKPQGGGSGGNDSDIVLPDSLPNPYPLTFTGAVTGTYDGSKALNVEIPSGGSVGGSNTWEQIAEIEITENVQQYVVSKDMNGESFELEKVAILMKVEKTTSQMDVSCSVAGNTLQKIKAVTTSTTTQRYGYAVFENKGFGLIPTIVKSSRADSTIGELQDTSNVWLSLNTTNNSYDGPETCKAIWIGSHYQTVLSEGTIIKVMGVRK